MIGGEIPDHTFRVKRTIAAEEPDKLDSPLNYTVEVDDADGKDASVPNMPPARQKLLDAVTALGEPSNGKQLVDWIATKHGHGLTRQTVSTEMNALLKDGLVDCIEQPGRETLWEKATPNMSDSARADTQSVLIQDSQPTSARGADQDKLGVALSDPTPTRHPTTGDSEGVVAVVAYKATATPDTPDDTLHLPGTDQPGQVRCIDCPTLIPAYQVGKRDGRCVSCHYRAGAA